MKLWPFGKGARIYADAAGATPLSARVVREMRRLEAHYANPGGIHAEALAAKKELEGARERAARALGAHADEITFTSGGTEANNLAIFGTLRARLHEHGELHAITTPIEHPSVLEPLRALEREGLYITYLPVDQEGRVDPKSLREAVNEQTVFVSVQMVNSEIGTIQDIKEIAKEIRHIRKSRNTNTQGISALPIVFHCDASQAPLWMPLNVEKLGIDLLTLDAQKIGGPKSSGLLYVRRGTELEPIIYGGGQEGGLRSGTENVVLAGALAEALIEAGEGAEARAVHVASVRDHLWAEIQQQFKDAVLHGARGKARVANNLHFSIPGLNGQMAVVALDVHGVSASTRSACSAADEEPSHVLKAIGVAESTAQEAIRITLLPEVTMSDAREIKMALIRVAERYRSVVN